MKTADADLKFPVLGFAADREMWAFADIETLTSCGPLTLKDNMQAGLELIDAEGRRFRVRSIRRIGRVAPWWKTLVMDLLTLKPQSRIEHELEPLEPISLSEVKRRVCTGLEEFSGDYCADDQREEILEPMLAQVRSAKSIAATHDFLGLDSFMAY
jgi:hypothetical protein